jgi:phage terminase large subunit-like protein
VHCEPRIAIVPDRVRHAGPQMTTLGRMAGIHLDEEQQFLAEVASGIGQDGKWSAFEVVIMGPRQSLGKTEWMLVRILAGLCLFKEELIVYSAHRAASTSKTFRRLKRAIDRNPRLGARIARVSNRLGSERIELVSGQAIECVARSTSSGRGFTGDCLCLDEAHELDAEQLSAILPMLATRPNPQVVYGLSMGNEQSTHLGGLRKRALDGASDVAWVEWSMGDDDRVDDRSVWIRCNPGYPSRIDMRYMEKEYAALGPDGFARERLGRSEWPTHGSNEWQVISEADWFAATHDENGNPWTDESFAALMSAPAPAPVPVREFDPFEAWGPDGIPPWVQRVG